MKQAIIKFNRQRLKAIIFKELLHMMRDKLTIGLVVGLPLVQLILFGFAINTNPKHLPTVLLNFDRSPVVNRLVQAIGNTQYFDITHKNTSLKQANQLIAKTKAQFIIEIPADFTRRLLRNQKPNLLVITDATDSVASASAVSALNQLSRQVFNCLSEQHGFHFLADASAPFNVIVHNRYNPEQITQYNIVPGLAGVILTMTMVMVTSLAIIREREQGTIESLLATPVRPLEVIIGKITPYIMVGYVQLLLILLSAVFLFHVPIFGSIITLLLTTFPFIVANLAVGITFSTLARTQLQAVQMTFFFFLPSILLSGFMFPFYGMPKWAQFIGNLLPLTHFLRIIRGIVLKGNGLTLLFSSLWPIFLFILIVGFISIKRYRRTV